MRNLRVGADAFEARPSMLTCEEITKWCMGLQLCWQIAREMAHQGALR